MLTALQTLPGLRGVKRMAQLLSSILRALPSIQPKQSASSCASRSVMLGLPERLLVQAEEQLFGRVVVLLEPLPKFLPET